jgi:AbrB family looped-hinge helix DNA binding protein
MAIANIMWHNQVVRVELDRFGRILIPKSLRDRIGLDAGSKLEIRETEEGNVLLQPVEESQLLTRDESGLLILHAQLLSPVDPVSFTRAARLKDIRE